MKRFTLLKQRARAIVPRGHKPWKIYSIIVTVSCALVYYFVFSPPPGFPLRSTIRIEPGSSVRQIAETLKNAGVIRSKIAFASYVAISGKEESVVAGQYKFDKPYSVFTIAKRLVSGTFGFHMVKLVIPEGATVLEIAHLGDKHLPIFNFDKFIEATKDKEGYLFPDTYYFTPVATEADVLKRLEQSFNTRVGPYEVQSIVTGHSFPEIIVMASLLEEEARTYEDRAMISGILWNRIEANMPLQVDAVFPYIVGRNTFQVTKADLANKSPYNTYVHRGLPPGPISNPGLSSIRAALQPTPSEYLYYLHDKNGTMHYARTFDEHVKNRRKYLN